ncbi:MAG: radical SAM protein [Clostridia bacterium]|nr:radical SAM protein [Clostridia bacterium]
MNKVMLLYPPGKLLQRSEDRAQCNLDDAATGAVHACNDLGYCAAVLLQKGYEVFLRDYQTEKASFEEVEHDVRAFRPDMIALSTTNTSVIDDLAFLDRISGFHKCVNVVKGAVFYDLEPELLDQLHLENADCLIGCEMEFVIGVLADFYLRSEGSLSGVNGIFYRDGESFIKNQFVCGLNDLDDLPFPARGLMKNELYVRPDTGEPMATIQTGLGCPSSCIYCLTPIISGKNVRKRDVESIYKELEECYYTFGIRNFFFKADTFTIDAFYAGAVCDRIINSPLHGKIEFTVNSRAKPLEPWLLKKLREAGCFTIAVGFESGSDETLRRIKKGTTVEDNLRAAKMIHDAGIPLFGFFMIGFPWETEEMIADTERLIRRTAPDFIELHVAMPYYGTGLYEECRSLGVLSGGGFGHDYYSPNTTGTVELSNAGILRLKKKILLRFYLRPSYIAKKMLGAAKSSVVRKNYVKYGFRLLAKNLPGGRRRNG